ncbi:MAG: hypothetical protein JMDDDDMK_03736 [Acidobacteria bacterium]|nr:hypothetical protein [Acidobacteriota bacterium]
MNDLAELLVADAELFEQPRNGEERAEESVALHAQLQIGAVGRFARNLEAGQREDADFMLDDLLARPQRQPLPRPFALLFGFPHQAAAFGHAVERVGMSEGFGIAAEHDIDVAQIAIHAHPRRRRNQEILSRRAFFLGAVFRISADVDDLFGIAEFVRHAIAFVNKVVEIADDRAEVFARSDRAPAANGMEAHGDGAFGQQRRRVIRLHLVRMIYAQNHKRRAVLRPLAVLARARARGELIRANDVLRPKIARPQAIDAGEKSRRALDGEARQPGLVLQSLIQSRANIAAHGIVARHRFVGSFQNDDVLLSGQRLHNRRFRERTDHIKVQRADLCASPFAQVINSGFDVFSG